MALAAFRVAKTMNVLAVVIGCACNRKMAFLVTAALVTIVIHHIIVFERPQRSLFIRLAQLGQHHHVMTW